LAQTVTSNIISCQDYQTEASIDVYVAELNIALTENCAAKKKKILFTKDNLNYGNKMCSLCGNKICVISVLHGNWTSVFCVKFGGLTSSQ